MSNSSQSTSIRPTKKQRELLSFIESFIGEHGYSPSYREIMNGLNYTSVATVSLHVTSLIRRGHLRKRDRSARSLEVVHDAGDLDEPISTDGGGEQWLLDQIEAQFSAAEHSKNASDIAAEKLAMLVSALHILGINQPAEQYKTRLIAINKKTKR